MEVIIYHNPRCSKSRQTLQLLEDKGINPKIRKYLEEPLNKQELESLSKKLNKPYHEMVRTKEAEFKDSVNDKNDDQQCLDTMLKFPKVIERPIVEAGQKAVFGRPPENVNELL